MAKRCVVTRGGGREREGQRERERARVRRGREGEESVRGRERELRGNRLENETICFCSNIWKCVAFNVGRLKLTFTCIKTQSVPRSKHASSLL